MEVKRQLSVLDQRLAEKRSIAGAEYSIADMALWPWYGSVVRGRIYDDADVFLAAAEYTK
jgi:GST-like protein